MRYILARKFRSLMLRVGTRIRAVLNWSFYTWAGGENRPVFHDIDQVRPELRRLDENWDVIREELEAVLPEKARIPRYYEANAKETEISGTTPGDWRVFYVNVWKGNDELSHGNMCPRTRELVQQVPGAMGAFFSILDPKKTVPAHVGPFMGYLRYHLGLMVPEEKPPTIRVKDEFYTWKERESVVFDDSWEHEVLNECEGQRVVLIVDFMRPMPWPLHLANRGWEWFKDAIGANADASKLGLRPAREDEEAAAAQAPSPSAP